MFKLDLQIVKFIYDSCYELGNSVGFGALEGAYIYGGLIVWGVISGLNMSKRSKK